MLCPRFRIQVAIYQFAQYVRQRQMGFLNARCHFTRNAKKNIGAIAHFTACFTGKADGQQPFGFGGSQRFDNVWRVPAG
jgi:hypothetical protein